MASRLRAQLSVILLALPLAALFIFLSHEVHLGAVRALNRHTLATMTEGMLRRSEVAIDYAIIELAKLIEADRLNCAPASIKSLEYAIFSSGALKSIVVRENAQTCGVSSHGDFMNGRDLVTNSVRARNANITLKGVTIDDVSSVAVTWKLSSALTATALINTEALVFDILPWDWRADGRNELALTSGAVIAKYSGADVPEDAVVFRAESKRYPLVASIGVPPTVISEPGTENRGILTLLIMGSLILGYFVARGLMPAANAVRTAIHRGDIVPHFQPSYDLRTRRITGFEVLARWPQKDGSMIPPVTFIPAIEANGWADDLLSSLISQTGVLMRDLVGGVHHVTFAFNVTSDQICDENFPAFLSDCLENAGFPRDRVIVEITERSEIRDHAQATKNIAKLAQWGIRCAIDDAGTGHNGLAMIQQFGAAILKIDKLFVDMIARDRRSRALVRTLVDVAAEYGMRTIAEGIETAKQLSALKSVGVDEAQGFHLCRPVEAASAIAEFVRSGTPRPRDPAREQEPHDIRKACLKSA